MLPKNLLIRFFHLLILHFQNLTYLNLPKANEESIKIYDYLHDKGFEMSQRLISNISYNLSAGDFIEKYEMVRALFDDKNKDAEYNKIITNLWGLVKFHTDSYSL